HFPQFLMISKEFSRRKPVSKPKMKCVGRGGPIRTRGEDVRFISFPLIARTGAVFLIALGAAAGLKPAWGCALSWDPRAPVQGTLFVVTVEDGEGLLRDVTGWAAGEPLHFFQGGDGDFRALAPAPLDRGANLSLQ